MVQETTGGRASGGGKALARKSTGGKAPRKSGPVAVAPGRNARESSVMC